MKALYMIISYPSYCNLFYQTFF